MDAVVSYFIVLLEERNNSQGDNETIDYMQFRLYPNSIWDTSSGHELRARVYRNLEPKLRAKPEKCTSTFSGISDFSVIY